MPDHYTTAIFNGIEREVRVEYGSALRIGAVYLADQCCDGQDGCSCQAEKSLLLSDADWSRIETELVLGPRSNPFGVPRREEPPMPAEAAA